MDSNRLNACRGLELQPRKKAVLPLSDNSNVVRVDFSAKSRKASRVASLRLAA
jgi:hypothetical protein